MNKIPNVTFRSSDLHCIMEGLGSDDVKSVVFERFIPTIKVAVEKKKKECILCTTGDYSIIVPQSSYSKVLETIEEYYVKKEKFEVCAQIKKLQAQIHG